MFSLLFFSFILFIINKYVDKISCTRCLAIHFTLEKEETSNKHHRHHKHHANCRDCEYRRQIAILDSLPESVVEGKHR